MIPLIALIVAAIMYLCILIALIAASRGVADWLERRRCICLYENWPAAIGVEVQDDGSEWLVYPRCPVHGHQAKTPIYREYEAATEESVAAQ